MKGARSAQSRPYWIRYVVAFWAVEKLTWAKDNVLIACVCSLAPGLIAAGISAAISDHKWRTVTVCNSRDLRRIVRLIPDVEAGCHALGARSREAAIHRRIDPEACLYQARIGCHTSLSASHRRGDIGDSRSSRRHHTFNARFRLASRLRHFS